MGQIADTMTALADAVREVTGKTEKMTCAEMTSALSDSFEKPAIVEGSGTPYLWANSFALSSYAVPDGTTRIADDCPAFANTRLKSITFPNTLEYLGGGNFTYQNRITDLVLPTSIKYLGKDPLTNSRGMSAFNATLASIGSNTPNLVHIGPSFFTNTSLTSFESNTTKTILIGDNAFMNAPLTYVLFPNAAGVRYIGYQAFSGCSALSSVDFPAPTENGVLDSSAFSDCTALTSVDNLLTFPTIGSYVFRGCTAITSAHLSSDIKSVGIGLFSDCTALETVTMSHFCPIDCSIPKYMFAGCSKLEDFVLNTNIEIIDEQAFYGTALRSTPFSLSAHPIRQIGSKAFYNCSNLELAELPETLTYIASDAFSGCSNVQFMIGFDDSELLAGFPWGATNSRYTIV